MFVFVFYAFSFFQSLKSSVSPFDVNHYIALRLIFHRRCILFACKFKGGREVKLCCLFVIWRWAIKCAGQAIHLIKTHLKGDVFEEGQQLEMKCREVQDLHFPVWSDRWIYVTDGSDQRRNRDQRHAHYSSDAAACIMFTPNSIYCHWSLYQCLMNRQLFAVAHVLWIESFLTQEGLILNMY